MNFISDKGMSVYAAIEAARKEMVRNGCEECTVTFNGIKLRMYVTSHEYDVVEIYNLKSRIRQLENKNENS